MRHADDFVELIGAFSGQAPSPTAIGPDDVAFLTYTSGTTGAPKGAMNTHGNVLFSARTYCDWVDLGPNDVIFGVAPLFHITGLVAHIALSILLPAPLVLAYRFDPGVVLDAIRERRPTFTIGSITAFIALMNDKSATAADFSTLSKIYKLTCLNKYFFRCRWLFLLKVHNICLRSFLIRRIISQTHKPLRGTQRLERLMYNKPQ